MRTRIHFQVARLRQARRPARAAFTATIVLVSGLGGMARGEVPGYYTDPSTGQVYRKVTRTVERPEVTTTTETRQQTVYTPKTVTETRPYSRTVYAPVTEFRWEPRLQHRWNPFRNPTVVYHHVPSTRWEARNEVVHRTTSETAWVAENRTVEVPVTQRRIVREERTDFEPVGRVAPQQTPAPGEASSAIAARLRPLGSGEQIIPTTPTVPPSLYATETARSPMQAGHRPNELVPSIDTVYGTPLVPAGTIATPLQPMTIFR